MPILVIACYRPEALKNHVQQLLTYRPDPSLFPIYVSIDCDSPETEKAARDFGSVVNIISYKPEKLKKVEKNQYKKISSHYKKAIDHVFNTSSSYDSIIITEDDLNISPDFFNYFHTLRPLLDQDTSIWCISAWNDNGLRKLIQETATTTLYRTDSKVGLGWMMTRSLWLHELSSIWPDGYWDDWMMLPKIRKNRQCIRPEVARTSMSNYGKTGASSGQFFHQYLAKIVQVEEVVEDLKELDLSKFWKENYNESYMKQVFTDAILKSDWKSAITEISKCSTGLRIPYDDYTTFVRNNELAIMDDTKSGVPRTAYEGIVTFYMKKCRFFLFPRQKMGGA